MEFVNLVFINFRKSVISPDILLSLHCSFLGGLCHSVHDILVLQPGIEASPPSVEAWSLNHWSTVEVLKWHAFLNLFFNYVFF